MPLSVPPFPEGFVSFEPSCPTGQQIIVLEKAPQGPDVLEAWIEEGMIRP